VARVDSWLASGPGAIADLQMNDNGTGSARRIRRCICAMVSSLGYTVAEDDEETRWPELTAWLASGPEAIADLQTNDKETEDERRITIRDARSQKNAAVKIHDKHTKF
jgi:hypothetical protein